MKKKVDVKKLILLNMPYLFAFYFADKISSAFRLAGGDSFANKLGAGFLNSGTAFQSPLPSFHYIDLLVGIAGAAGLRLLLYIKSKNKKNYRHGEEYGSNASWFCCCSHFAIVND